MKLTKKIEILCKQYIINIVLCSFLCYIGSLVKDSSELKAASSVSIILAAVMVIYMNWRRRNGNGVDLEHERAIEMCNERDYDLIRKRCMMLREEVKNRFADMGIKWIGSFYIHDIEKDSFNEIIALEALMICDQEADVTDFKKQLKENNTGFGFRYPLPDEKYVTHLSEAALMTEEEQMERECLKKLNII